MSFFCDKTCENETLKAYRRKELDNYHTKNPKLWGVEVSEIAGIVIALSCRSDLEPKGVSSCAYDLMLSVNCFRKIIVKLIVKRCYSVGLSGISLGYVNSILS